MLKSHTRQIDTIDITAIKRARKKNKRRQNRGAALGRPAMKSLGGGGGGGGGFNKFAVDQPLPLVLPWFLRHLVVRFAWKIPSS